MTTIVFRVDASQRLGTGHVMRCLTLADSLREQGADCSFIGRECPGHMLARIRAEGFATFSLAAHQAFAADDGHTPATGVSEQTHYDWRTDADQTQAILARAKPDWLVVDHYALDARWEATLKPHCRKIMVIDDLADRPHDCDVLLDQNLQTTGRYTSLVPKNCRVLIGPKFALLRPQFAEARKSARVREGRVTRLLIFFGGADVGANTLNAICAIGQLSHDTLSVDVVIGGTNPNKTAIEAAGRNLRNVTVHCDVKNMASLMATADLFVGAGGTASWERCCLGLPSIAVSTADNQIVQSQVLARAGAQLYLGAARSVVPARMAQLISETMQLPELLAHMSERARELVDGLGVIRVRNTMLAEAVSLRRANTRDCDNLFAWRNHVDTRRFSGDSQLIDHDTHTRWFAATLSDPNRALLIAENRGCAVGVLRYDFTGDTAKVSIYLVPGFAGQGWGSRILSAGHEWLRRERHEVRIIEAEIRCDNSASLAAFKAAGYQLRRSLFRKEIDG